MTNKILTAIFMLFSIPFLGACFGVFNDRVVHIYNTNTCSLLGKTIKAPSSEYVNRVFPKEGIFITIHDDLQGHFVLRKYDLKTKSCVLLDEKNYPDLCRYYGVKEEICILKDLSGYVYQETFSENINGRQIFGVRVVLVDSSGAYDVFRSMHGESGEYAKGGEAVLGIYELKSGNIIFITDCYGENKIALYEFSKANCTPIGKKLDFPAIFPRISFADDYLYVSTRDDMYRAIISYDVANGDCKYICKREGHGFEKISPNSSKLIYNDGNGTVWEFDLDSKQTKCLIEKDRSEIIYDVAISKNFLFFNRAKITKYMTGKVSAYRKNMDSGEIKKISTPDPIVLSAFPDFDILLVECR